MKISQMLSKVLSAIAHHSRQSPVDDSGPSLTLRLISAAVDSPPAHYEEKSTPDSGAQSPANSGSGSGAAGGNSQV